MPDIPAHQTYLATQGIAKENLPVQIQAAMRSFAEVSGLIYTSAHPAIPSVLLPVLQQADAVLVERLKELHNPASGTVSRALELEALAIELDLELSSW